MNLLTHFLFLCRKYSTSEPSRVSHSQTMSLAALLGESSLIACTAKSAVITVIYKTSHTATWYKLDVFSLRLFFTI